MCTGRPAAGGFFFAMQEKCPLQRSVVLHNLSTAAGDDASHHHARDEAPALRTGPRGTSGIDNGDAHSCVQIHRAAAHAHSHAYQNTHRRKQINASAPRRIRLFFRHTLTPKNTHLHRVASLHKRHRSFPRNLTQQYVREEGKKIFNYVESLSVNFCLAVLRTHTHTKIHTDTHQ